MTQLLLALRFLGSPIETERKAQRNFQADFFKLEHKEDSTEEGKVLLTGLIVGSAWMFL